MSVCLVILPDTEFSFDAYTFGQHSIAGFVLWCYWTCIAKYVEHFMHKCLLWFYLTHKHFSILNLCFPLCVVLLKEINKWPLKTPLNFKF